MGLNPRGHTCVYLARKKILAFETYDRGLCGSHLSMGFFLYFVDVV